MKGEVLAGSGLRRRINKCGGDSAKQKRMFSGCITERKRKKKNEMRN